MIERNPEIMFGKPVIKGTRITVKFLMRKLADGFNVEEILEMYPHLTLAQILAAFAQHDNSTAITQTLSLQK